MKNIEDKIRDHLAKNLDILGLNLQLIETEHYIRKSITTKSFIDILAKDELNNYVVIEVKRSNQAAREAIHEIYKYTEAVKQKYQASSGEIKSVIVSTEWDELLVPFSSYANESRNSIIGFEIVVDSNYNIVRAERVKPLRMSNGRVFSPIQECNLYKNEESLHKGIESHHRIFKEKNIHNYVLIVLRAPVIDRAKYLSSLEQVLSDITGQDIAEVKGNFDAMEEFEYMIYSAFQRLSYDEYVKILERDTKQLTETLESMPEQEHAEDALEHLENSVIGNLQPWFYKDYTEIGYPAKFKHKILEEEKWTIIEIIRSKSLAANKLLTDQRIIDEIGGATGIDNVIFNDSCSLEHRAKYNEIKERSLNTLKYNAAWRNHLKVIYEKLDVLHEGKLSVEIYAPNNILLSITKMVTSEDYQDWQPIYGVTYTKEDSKMYTRGVFHWSEKSISFDQLLDKYFGGDISLIFMPLIWGGHEANNDQILVDLGLSYRTYLIEERGDVRDIFHYSNYRFVKTTTIKNGLKNFIERNRSFVDSLVNAYHLTHYKAGYS